MAGPMLQAPTVEIEGVSPQDVGPMGISTEDHRACCKEGVWVSSGFGVSGQPGCKEGLGCCGFDSGFIPSH